MRLLVVFVLCLAITMRGTNAHHTCIHNSLKYPLTIGGTTATSHRRAMSPQSTTFRPIRIWLNYTFLDSPELDVDSVGNAAVCLTVGQRIIVGAITFTDNPCLDDNGDTVATSNCYFICTDSDLTTATRIARAKEIMAISKSRFEAFLKVQDLGNVTLSASRCGGVFVDNQTVPADVVILPTVRSTPYFSTTLAFASPCQIHEVSSRPIITHVNIQPSTLETNSDIATVVTHEMTHGLGFSVDMYKFYRHPNDPNKTYYEYDPDTYPFGPLRATTGAVYNGDVNGRFGPQVNASALGAGKKIELISPNVIETAKEFYQCSTIDGVELENNGAASSAGTHWEERILYWELMTSTQKSLPGKLTNFTLSLFKDMGFYDVDRTTADPMDFGFRKGCDFVQKKCNESSWYFCSGVGQQTCGYNNQYIGGCNEETRTTDFPTANQYFPGEPKRGGSNDYLDNCPFSTPLSDGACVLETARPEFASTGGNSSRCYVSTVVTSEYNPPDAANTLCFATICKDANTALLRLQNELYECKVGSSVEIMVYPRLPQATSDAPENVTGKAVYSAIAYGVIQCPDPVPTCDPIVADLNPDVVRLSGAYPALHAIHPFMVPKGGGDVIIIEGSDLSGCSGIRLGGLAAEDFTVINSTHAKATSPTITYTGNYGGSGTGGLGMSQADLQCSVTGCENCFISSVAIMFVESDDSGAADELFDSVSEWFGTTTGLAVAAGIGLLLLCLLGYCVFQQCCKKEEVHPPKKSRRRSQHSSGDFGEELL